MVGQKGVAVFMRQLKLNETINKFSRKMQIDPGLGFMRTVDLQPYIRYTVGTQIYRHP
jgi:hypothetical protein